MNRKIAVIVSAAVLAGGAGIAVAASGDSATTGSGPSMSRPGGPGGDPGGFDLSALAEELGVTESRLQEAMQAARPTDGQRPDASSMAETLAEELGLSADKVQTALEEAMPSGGQGGPPPGADQTAPQSGDTSQS